MGWDLSPGIKWERWGLSICTTQPCVSNLATTEAFTARLVVELCNELDFD
jgi:hypothetical protein